MKNLGKKIFILLTFLTTAIYASVTARVEPAVVYSGESATYILKISGQTVHKPQLDDICGNAIVGTSSQTSIEMVNMDYKKSYILSYEFVPQKSCTIKPTAVEIDGKVEHSNEVKVLVKPASQNKDVPFMLTLTPSKNSVYVGEPFKVKLQLKQKKDVQVVDSEYIEPKFKGFWLKSKSNVKRIDDGEYIITTAVYELAPQRVGILKIPPAQLRIATRVNKKDIWGSFIPQLKWQHFASNTVSIKVEPLPNNAKIVGNFTISAVADKTEITPNEAVNVTITVKGDGNLEDIGSFKPYINGVNVFDEKINIQGNTLTQKLAFVSDKDFTIPPFKLAFYNLKTKRVEQIKTKPISIKVKGSSSVSTTLNVKKADQEIPLNIKKTTKESDNSGSVNYIWLIIVFILGLALGIALMVFKPFKLSKREQKFNIKDEKLLLLKLLPYKDKDSDVEKIITILEGNFYGEKKGTIDKKLLKEIVKKYDIS